MFEVHQFTPKTMQQSKKLMYIGGSAPKNNDVNCICCSGPGSKNVLLIHNFEPGKKKLLANSTHITLTICLEKFDYPDLENSTHIFLTA